MKKVKTKLIKPKKQKEKKEKSLDFLNPMLFLILGIILLTNSSNVVIFVFRVIGWISVFIGLYHFLSFYSLKKQFNIDDMNKLLTGTSGIFIGLMIVILSGAFEAFMRFIIGFILIYNGLRNCIFFLLMRNYVTLGIGIIIISMGLYTIFATNIILEIIGALLIIASIIDFVRLSIEKK